jgi:hypothetical protein
VVTPGMMLQKYVERSYRGLFKVIFQYVPCGMEKGKPKKKITG